MVVRRFGTWNKGLAKAGLKVGKRCGIPRVEMYEQIESMWDALGRAPSRSDWKMTTGKISSSCIERRFGSWRAALEAFVGWANRRGKRLKGRKLGGVKIVARVFKKRGTGRVPSIRLRYEVLRRDQFRCVQCGRSPANEPGVILHLDHVKPWSKGGETVFENLQTLCERCNLGKSCLAAHE